MKHTPKDFVIIQYKQEGVLVIDIPKYEDVRVVKEAGLRSAVVIRVGSTPTPRKVHL